MKGFCAYYYFVGWTHLSLGLHLCLHKPNVEVHLPFGFVRIGWCDLFPQDHRSRRRTFGYEPALPQAHARFTTP